MTLTVHADRNLIRAGARSCRYLCAEVQAPEAAPQAGRRPVNLAFVLDRSGSMEGDKIAHAREAAAAVARIAPRGTIVPPKVVH